MSEDRYSEVKTSVLSHMQSLFDEMEENMATSHQEKYALLEDAFENASDEDEIRVAFEQWYAEHADDLGLDYDVDELWEQALRGEVSFDNYKEDDDGKVEVEEKIIIDDFEEKDDYKKDYGDGNDE